MRYNVLISSLIISAGMYGHENEASNGVNVGRQ